MIKLNICARACIIFDDKLLLVTNDESYWYLPGGHQEPKESLQQCAQREVFEETGLGVQCQDILYCSEFFDTTIDSHKVEVVFKAIPTADLPVKWQDSDSSVTKSQWFTFNEIQSLNIQPRYLRDGKWLTQDLNNMIYQGYESNA